jgi:hypothetical protein
MQPIRQIFDHAPDAIPVPEALRRRRVEIILWPLEDTADTAEDISDDYERATVDTILMPSREERHVRR